MARNSSSSKTSKTSPNPSPPPAARTTPTNIATPVSTTPMQKSPPPTHDDIARRAYELYLARGGEHGRADDDWQQAERELRLGRQ